MCGDMGKAVLGALTGALLCGLVSDAAYLQQYENSPQRYDNVPQRYDNVPQRYEQVPQRYENLPQQYEPSPQHYEPQVQFNQDYFVPRPPAAYQQKRKPLREHEKPQDLRNVPGTPGVDFPIYHQVPETGFSCAHVPVHPGMYANVETGCQAYHVCHDGREGHQGASFLCTNGTLFDQAKFACDWWYNVDCSQAINHYQLNANPDKNPYTPKKKVVEEEEPQNHKDYGIYYRDI